MCQRLPRAGALPACFKEIRHSRSGSLEMRLAEYRDKGKIARRCAASSHIFIKCLASPERIFSLSASDSDTWTAIEKAVHLRRVNEESVTAVLQLLDQTSASIKLTNAMPTRTIDQSPTSRPKTRRAVMGKSAVLFSTPNLLKTIGIVFSASIASMLPSAQIAD